MFQAGLNIGDVPGRSPAPTSPRPMPSKPPGGTRASEARSTEGDCRTRSSTVRHRAARPDPDVAATDESIVATSTPRASKPGSAPPAWRSTRTKNVASTTSSTLQAIWPTTNALRRRARPEDDRTPSLSAPLASTPEPLSAGSTPKITATPSDSDSAKDSTRQSSVSGTTIDDGSGGRTSIDAGSSTCARPMPRRPPKRQSTSISVSS